MKTLANVKDIRTLFFFSSSDGHDVYAPLDVDWFMLDQGEKDKSGVKAQD